jgi:hypothetical protein
MFRQADLPGEALYHPSRLGKLEQAERQGREEVVQGGR